PLACIADGANELSLEILLSFVRIANFVLARGIGDSIDRVVAASEIVVERSAEFNNRVPSVRFDVATKGRHLVHDVVLVEHSDRSKLDADGDRALEEFAHV